MMKILDLFCGAGLASWGYWRSGRFSEVVGVDNEEQPAYSFDFVLADALSLDYEFLSRFDFIHASPPCQAYSKNTPDKSIHPRLILPVKHMLYASGVPHVVENVEGSGAELRPNLVLSGRDVGLPSLRRRYFYLSVCEAAALLMSGRVDPHMSSARGININGAVFVSRENVIKALGLDDMISSWRLSHISVPSMEQGVAPIMAFKIAAAVFPDKFRVGG